jgi:hypothetical protein
MCGHHAGSRFQISLERKRVLTGDGSSSTPVTLPDLEKNVEIVTFSGDSRWLITRNHDRGTINLWRLRSDELKILACRTAGRNMTTEEWATYLPGQPYTDQCADFTTKPS